MIHVKRTGEDSDTKVVGKFMRRVKASNLVSRARKTKYRTKPASHLVQKRKAIRKADYERMEDFLSRTGKK
jgi:hypothetical protein